MTLAEVLMAALVVLGASGASLQIWSTSAAQEQRWTDRSTALQASEDDRIHLQASWRLSLPRGLDCRDATTAMAQLAALQPAQGSLNRQLQVAADGRSLHVSWPAAERQRWISPAGLGLCQSAPSLDGQLSPSGETSPSAEVGA